MDEVRYLKRKIRSGNLDVHPTEKALVVNYDVEALILGELGDPMLGDRKECQKIIRLRSLNADTNVSLLAREIIDKCSLIHESKLHEVEQLIYYLQNRKSSDDDLENTGPPLRPISSTSLNVDSGDTKRAIISNIDHYIELLYEEISDKIKGSSLILKLTRIPDNLQELSKNETLLSVLARVLREDWKKSIELSINIIYIFFCFATYSQFHNIVVDYRIGSLCMDIIDYELIRFDQWKDDLEKRRRHFENNTGMCLLPTMSTDNGAKKTKLIDNTWSSNSSFDRQANRQSTDGSLNIVKGDIDKLKDDLERHREKFKCLTEKQEQLLKENKEVEIKMRKKNVIGMLLKTLDRTNTDLLILVVTFLKKLSIYRENKDDMVDGNIIEKLPKLLNNTSADLDSMTLRLLFNLSFDPKLRGKMIKVGLLPKLVKLLIQDDVNRSTILGLLYHASIDDKVKMMFINTEYISLITEMLLELNDEIIFPELVALCINLATNNKNADLMIENNRLKRLIKKSFKNQNSLLMKIVRNISQNESTREHFIEFVGDFAMALTQSDCQDFVLEIIGVMGNLALSDLDYSQILQRCNLIPWICNSLVPGKAQDDLVLEVVIFLGTAAASDEDCAQVICKAGILLSLIELLKAKQEDDEIVLQIIYVFYQISKHDSTRNYLIQETGNEAPGYLIDLMHDKNPAIRKICDACLDVIALCDKDWAARIKVEKFRSHNQQWLDMIESINGDTTATSFSVADEDNFTSFASRDLLKHTMLFPSGINTRFNIDDGDLVTKTFSDSSENPSHLNSQYNRDLDEICEILTTSKFQLSMSSGIDLYHSLKLKFDTDNSHLVL